MVERKGKISKSKNGDYLLVKSIWQDGSYEELKELGCYYKDGFSVIRGIERICFCYELLTTKYNYIADTEASDVYLKVREEIEGLEDLKKIKNATDIKIDHKLRLPAYPFQMAGINFLEKAGGKCFLCDDMGLGKTMQAISFAERNKLKTLIICPATLKLVWQDEIEKFTGKSSQVIYATSEQIENGFQYTILNYDIIKKMSSLIGNKWDLLILDESTYIKNRNAKRTKAINELNNRFKYKLLLTGTPILNKPSELYVPLNIIQPGEWGSFWNFAKRYCDAKKGYWGWDYSGSSNEEELKRRLEPIMIRRTKKEVLKELPDKIYQNIRIEMEEETARKYQLALDDFRAYLLEQGYSRNRITKVIRAEAFVRIGQLRQLVLNDKSKTVEDLIKNLNGNKLVIFSDYINPLKFLHEKYKKESVILTGANSNEERKEAINKFQSDDKIRIFLGSTKAAGFGITLTTANKVVFLSLPWVPGDMDQATDRCHRIGQKDTVNVYSLLCGEIDNYMMQILEKKRKIVNKIIGDEKVESTDLVMENLLEKIAERHDEHAKK